MSQISISMTILEHWTGHTALILMTILGPPALVSITIGTGTRILRKKFDEIEMKITVSNSYHGFCKLEVVLHHISRDVLSL